MKKYILFCYLLLFNSILTGCSAQDNDGFFITLLLNTWICFYLILMFMLKVGEYL